MGGTPIICEKSFHNYGENSYKNMLIVPILWPNYSDEFHTYENNFCKHIRIDLIFTLCQLFGAYGNTPYISW